MQMLMLILLLVTSRNCLSCIFPAAGSLRNRIDESYDSIVTVANSEDARGNVAAQYFLDLNRIRDKARRMAATSELFRTSKNDIVDIAAGSDVITDRGAGEKQQRQDKRYVSCEYATLPLRHVRAAEPKDGPRQASKRRQTVSDLTLCHFKICNMGRKRTTRFLIMKHHPSFQIR